MNVRAKCPFGLSTGVCHLPERRVNTEWRTMRANCRALWRRVMLSIATDLDAARRADGANLGPQNLSFFLPKTAAARRTYSRKHFCSERKSFKGLSYRLTLRIRCFVMKLGFFVRSHHEGCVSGPGNYGTTDGHQPGQSRPRSYSVEPDSR